MGKSKINKKLEKAREVKLEKAKQIKKVKRGRKKMPIIETTQKKKITPRIYYLKLMAAGKNTELICPHYFINSSYVYKLLKGGITIKNLHSRLFSTIKRSNVSDKAEASAYKYILEEKKKIVPVQNYISGRQ